MPVIKVLTTIIGKSNTQRSVDETPVIMLPDISEGTGSHANMQILHDRM
jgi:hypothetical protein